MPISGTTTRSCRRSTCAAAGSTATCSSRPPITTSSSRTPGSWARQFTANFGLALRVSAVAAARRGLGERRGVHRQPALPADDQLQQGQEQLGPARRDHLRHQRPAPDGRARRVGHLLRPHQQQRHLELAHEQRGDVRDLLASRRRRRARRNTRTSSRRRRPARARCRRFSIWRRDSSGRRSRWARSRSSTCSAGRPRCRRPTSTARAAICRRSSTRTCRSRPATVDLIVDGDEPRQLPVLPRRASRQPGDATRSRSTTASNRPITRSCLQVNRRFSGRPAVQRELHAVEVRGHRAELDDVHLELLDARQPVRRLGELRPDELRPQAPLRRPASTTRPTTSGAFRSAAPARSRAACRSTRRFRSTPAR